MVTPGGASISGGRTFAFWREAPNLRFGTRGGGGRARPWGRLLQDYFFVVQGAYFLAAILAKAPVKDLRPASPRETRGVGLRFKWRGESR